MFKTAGKFGFDSLYLTERSMQVLDGYINHIRPLLRPTCDFVLVTRNGGQHNKLGERSREVASKAHEYLERLHGEKGSELEIDVRLRLSGNSASSEDQNGSKTDTSSNDEGETIAETPPKRLSGVPRLKRENAFIATDFPARKKSLMFTPEEDNYLKAGIERHGYSQWKAIIRDPEFRFQEGRTANSLLSRAARRFGSLSKLS